MSDAGNTPLPFPGDSSEWERVMAQMQHAFAAMEGARDGHSVVNWGLSAHVAHTVASGAELSSPAVTSQAATPRSSPVSEEQHKRVTEEMHLADLWLDDATTLPSGVNTVVAWNRDEWIDHTLPRWKTLCDPVAEKVVGAVQTLLPNELNDVADGPIPRDVLENIVRSMGGLHAAFAQIGGALFGAQVGHGLGQLAREVLSSTEIGLPLGPAGTAAIVPENTAQLTDGLEQPHDQVQLYIALREAAHHRLYGHVPWLRSHVIDAVGAYARGIQIDEETFAEAFENMQTRMDPSDPESIELMVSEQLFRPATTEEQKAALRKLETALALIEGWVTHVVDSVAAERFGGAEALSEMFRRRRAAGGPAEHTFATLVGLELRPRRLREAAALWKSITEQRGVEEREKIWDHPDLLPTADDLESPEEFVKGREEFTIDDLREM